jgi:hypothetical protein
MSSEHHSNEHHAAPFGTLCYGRSPTARCTVPPIWMTTQSGGANPIFACGRHLTWLIGLRTSPGASITVTRKP